MMDYLSPKGGRKQKETAEIRQYRTLFLPRQNNDARKTIKMKNE